MLNIEIFDKFSHWLQSSLTEYVSHRMSTEVLDRLCDYRPLLTHSAPKDQTCTVTTDSTHWARKYWTVFVTVTVSDTFLWLSPKYQTDTKLLRLSPKYPTGTVNVTEVSDRYCDCHRSIRQVLWLSLKYQTSSVTVTEVSDRYCDCHWSIRQVLWLSRNIRQVMWLWLSPKYKASSVTVTEYPTGTVTVTEVSNRYCECHRSTRQVLWLSPKYQTSSVTVTEVLWPRPILTEHGRCGQRRGLL